MDDKTKGEIINLAYYYIFGASLLMHRFARLFEDAGLGEHGIARMRVNQAKASIEGALRQIDSFDKNFLTSCQGSGIKWDAYMAVANELIGMNLLYITHSYEHYADAAKVIELVKSQGMPNEMLDELAQGYLKKAMKG